jgi:hypothetical protein
LVGDTYTSYLGDSYPSLLQGLLSYGQRCTEKLVWVLLYPAGLRVEPVHFPVGFGDHLTFFIKEESGASCSSLI